MQLPLLAGSGWSPIRSGSIATEVGLRTADCPEATASTKAERSEYAETVGQDGYALLQMLEAEEAPEVLATLPRVGIFRKIWDRHYRPSEDGKACFIPAKELGPASEAVELPYDTEAHYRTRFGTSWTGYMVHLTETCDEERPHLITHVDTTQATA